ncbi:MAG: phosphoribosylformylglycinamidine cyclo-ligase [Deltaproteobacteria bacterium]|nr:phosphoribosylformylglycinamidine cyclo-ligase [Deltaproteobacteria bacterium]
MTASDKGTTYKDAGVDIAAGNRLVKNIAPLVKETFRPEVLADIGGFGALFSLHTEKYRDPVLVSSTDGVGTKLKLAFLADKHDSIGIDLVAMVVNDIVVQGAEPLFFLDYLATSRLEVERATEIIAGIARGCKEAGCSLIGGETAEMPGFYQGKDYELAGFAVGIVDKSQLIDGSEIKVGDRIIGLGSSGLHSNGYSLARRVLLEDSAYALDEKLPELELPLGEELLRPTRIYVRTILNLQRDFRLKGVAHITGGGLQENIVRVVPDRCQVQIDLQTWPRPPIFEIIARQGKVSEKEMLTTFNCGIGMALIVAVEDVEDILERLHGLGENGYLIGEIGMREPDAETIVFLNSEKSRRRDD